ncbi:class I SAM-dependent methyltransferase [Luteimicrobium subarcticum]|uniref:Methyltransferase family protein n=1 Tax=Luteimicrobium subarcticum TaxID=620910 RepID=A0A2M8WUY7_9MICO|nr:class I SAM-dependent methyltransferase [Luteimicrobium subarcticum]PJI94718.1 methyltransferase family protein [Luteimicrobium subarcticum]
MTLQSKVRTATQLAGELARRPQEVVNLPRTLRSRRMPLDVGLPWLAFAVIRRLDEIVGPQTTVFEFGGGGSTVWFAQRAGKVVTVEHDTEWASLLTERFADVPNVEIRHVAAPGGDYDAYVAAVDDLPDESVDLVVVDGRSRVRCATAAMSKVRPGGHLALDDSQRPYYRAAHERLSSWPHETIEGLAPYKFDFGHTTIWQRPS